MSFDNRKLIKMWGMFISDNRFSSISFPIIVLLYASITVLLLSLVLGLYFESLSNFSIISSTETDFF